MSVDDRAAGAFYGLAIGDALGMPTQLLSPAEIGETFGLVTGFERPTPSHPIAAGMPAGSVTDDTEQALIVARLLLAGGGHIDPHAFAAELTDWEGRMRARGSLDLLGPSTSAALAALAAGAAPDEAGRTGSTNGAAMRVTPVGIATGCADLERLADRVVESCVVTHNTGIAIAGACAVAAAVSAGIAGATAHDATCVAIAAARVGARRGHWVAGADVAARIEFAVDRVSPAEPAASLAAVRDLIGTSLATQESVPAAFAIAATFPADPWRACCAAAGIGGDCDTIAAMTGAIAGAARGLAGFPPDAPETIEAVNGLGIAAVAHRLAALR